MLEEVAPVQLVAERKDRRVQRRISRLPSLDVQGHSESKASFLSQEPNQFRLIVVLDRGFPPFEKGYLPIQASLIAEFRLLEDGSRV